MRSSRATASAGMARHSAASTFFLLLIAHMVTGYCREVSPDSVLTVLDAWPVHLRWQ